MAIEINKEIRELFTDKETLKVLASIDKHGIPHVTFKGSVDIDEDGNIYYLEVLESSQTNKNLTYSIWFDKTVAITILGKNKKSYQIKGSPHKVHIAGPLFEEKYKEIIARNPDLDLSGVWIIEPNEIIEETFQVKLNEERKKHPIIGHLDRILREE